jgi:hypothetical protein
MLHVRAVRDRVADAEVLLGLAPSLVAAQVALAGQLRTLRLLSLDAARLRVLRQAIDRFGPKDETVSLICSVASGCHPRLTQVCEVLGAAPWPFAGGDADVTLGRYVVPSSPAAQEYGELIAAVEGSVERFVAAQVRVYAKLVAIAVAVEQACGVKSPAT